MNYEKSEQRPLPVFLLYLEAFLKLTKGLGVIDRLEMGA